jgi:ring-1,2-phenylacetyl-CoA epoxidase subunit PaaC
VTDQVPAGTPRALGTAGYALLLGDDALILAHRLSEWVASAPELEEDVALANIGLDLLGQARSLLGYAGELLGDRTEDDLAYLRGEREFRNCQLVEQPNGDFGHTIARQLLFSTYQGELYAALARSRDTRLAAIAAKAVKEVAYHRDHAVMWTLRLGDGTDESHRRMQAGLDAMWPYSAELFDAGLFDTGLFDTGLFDAGLFDAGLFDAGLLDAGRLDAGRSGPGTGPGGLVEAGIAVDPASLRPAWESAVTAVLTEATLAVPQTSWRPGGGRRGIHTEAFGYLLAEMQHLHRSYPGARW